MTHDTNNMIANIQQHVQNGDHVHLYGDMVASIADEVFGKDEYHLDVMPNNVKIFGPDYIVLDSSKGEIYIAEDDVLAFHVPSQP